MIITPGNVPWFCVSVTKSQTWFLFYYFFFRQSAVPPTRSAGKGEWGIARVEIWLPITYVSPFPFHPAIYCRRSPGHKKVSIFSLCVCVRKQCQGAWSQKKVRVLPRRRTAGKSRPTATIGAECFGLSNWKPAKPLFCFPYARLRNGKEHMKCGGTRKRERNRWANKKGGGVCKGGAEKAGERKTSCRQTSSSWLYVILPSSICRRTNCRGHTAVETDSIRVILP